MRSKLTLLEALKDLGSAGVQSGKAAYTGAKELAKANPKTASAVGGAGAGALLLALLGGKTAAEKDAEEQAKRLKLSQMYEM